MSVPKTLIFKNEENQEPMRNKFTARGSVISSVVTCYTVLHVHVCGNNNYYNHFSVNVIGSRYARPTIKASPVILLYY